MKRYLSVFLAIVLLFATAVSGNASVQAAKKTEQSRAIAIVFDNSGSMYIDGEKAWCRATYAMEVFASMLNKGDTLQIYPMHPITVDKKEYSMKKPFVVDDASQASTIRKIYTKEALGTPIESIDAAVKGVKKITADKKYVIVLTDGDSFYQNNVEMNESATKNQLDSRFKKHAGKNMTLMYLGIGKNVVMPDTSESKYFVKKQAKNSKDTLSALTEMCNQIFGRDTLPKSHLSKNKIKLDISISKLIVFVQGENVSDLKVTGSNGEVGKLESTASTKYGTEGCGNYKAVPDKSLQGMMVTYTNCSAGNYTINYKGNANNIEVYYEPNADLDFIFTDSEGNLVDPNSLYEGEYKVSFGMKDGKTGQLIDSELLGKPKYKGSYFINGEETTFSEEGYSGSVPITLKMNDSFDANLTVTYLSGYTINKDSSDFGWPEGGIKVAARPAGELSLKVNRGDSKYSLLNLEKGKPYTAEVYHQGKKLTGKELEKVELKWDPDTSYAEIKQEFADDHYNLTLHYKDPNEPANTICGKCQVPIYALYAAQGSDESKAQATLTYNIVDDFTPVKLNLLASQNYIVISELDESQEIVAKLSMKGRPLTADEFKSVALQVDTGGIKYKATPNEKDSSYSIKLLATEKVEEKDYPIKVTAKYTDQIGRETRVEDSVKVTLSNTPLWLKWLFIILGLLLLILIIWRIMRIRVLPSTKILHKRGESYLSVNGREVEQANLSARRTGKKIVLKSTYSGNNYIINVSNIEPGKESYLSKRQVKRSILVNPKNVSKVGNIKSVDIAGVGFKTDKNGKLMPEEENQKPFLVRNNSTVTFDGNLEENGKTKKFHAEIPLTFKKR